MGFLKRMARIEDWLTKSSSEFHELSQREYVSLVSNWRKHFEESLEAGRHVAKGPRAEREMELSDCSKLFIFSMPGYRLLPSGTDPTRDAAYAYVAIALQRIDWVAANASDAILADEGFTFTCLCTHEVGTMAEVQFLTA
jgi:hypothetical protein